MLIENERLIIVVGMPHSGTTILTHTLRQHRGLICCTNGTEAWLLENTYLPLEDTHAIQRLLDGSSKRRVLLKRPLNEVFHGSWMRQEMPNAKFIYCYRDFEEIQKSWSGPGSVLENEVKNGSVDYQRETYNTWLKSAEEFGASVPYFYKLHHPAFVSNPRKIIEELIVWLSLPHQHLRVSQVSNAKNIKHFLCGGGR